MSPENILILTAVSCGLASVCVVLSLWGLVRLASLEAWKHGVVDKLPHNRAAELEVAFDHMNQAFEGLQQKNAEFKQSVHNSVNRLDQVMRRNEKAVTMLDENGELANTDFVPAEDPTAAGSVAANGAAADSVSASKQAALRARYNKNRGIG